MVLAEFSGKLSDERVSALRQDLDAALADPHCSSLVLDLSGATFLDSSGIGFLVALASRLKAGGRQLLLRDPSSQVRKTLELVRLITYFSVLERSADLAGLE
jgi:anti-sigma B factor antagonist